MIGRLDQTQCENNGVTLGTFTIDEYASDYLTVDIKRCVPSARFSVNKTNLSVSIGRWENNDLFSPKLTTLTSLIAMPKKDLRAIAGELNAVYDATGDV